MRRIHTIPVHDRPREKLYGKGARALSDVELLAILLGSGTKKAHVLSVAKRVLRLFDGADGPASLTLLQTIEGIGDVKAAQLLAAQEFFSRRIGVQGLRISCPSDILPLVRYLATKKQEHLICISLNGAQEVIHSRIVSVGLVDRAQIHPREIFADPITDRASAIIIAHNHPSGDVLPSKADITVTKHLVRVGALLGIRLLDHLIFNQQAYYSFLEEGQLENAL